MGNCLWCKRIGSTVTTDNQEDYPLTENTKIDNDLLMVKEEISDIHKVYGVDIRQLRKDMNDLKRSTAGVDHELGLLKEQISGCQSTVNTVSLQQQHAFTLAATASTSSINTAKALESILSRVDEFDHLFEQCKTDQ